MISLQSLKTKVNHESILGFIFILFLVFNFRIPTVVANLIDSYLGKILILLAVFYLFAKSHILLAVLGLLVAYKLLKSSFDVTGMATYDSFNHLKTEEQKWEGLPEIHSFPYTLEEELVNKMSVNNSYNTDYVKASYRPVLNNIHNASSII